MVVGANFIWLHLPKTGGTTTNAIFRALKLADVQVDADDDRAKHDAIRSRPTIMQSDVTRGRFINTRRLSSWLISDWLHKRRHYPGLEQLPFGPVRSGLFYSLRLGGVWVAADWWIRHFELDASVTALRLEYLREDFNRLLHPLLPNGTPRLGELPRLNAAPPALQTVPALSEADMRAMHETNPLWSDWERRWYHVR